MIIFKVGGTKNRMESVCGGGASVLLMEEEDKKKEKCGYSFLYININKHWLKKQANA